MATLEKPVQLHSFFAGNNPVFQPRAQHEKLPGLVTAKHVIYRVEIALWHLGFRFADLTVWLCLQAGVSEQTSHSPPTIHHS
jgi:hypothetical protein